VRAAAIHGGRSQNQRDKALAMFKLGRVEALIATDVAARGIHVDGVACVLHYDTPEDGKAYLHRSGRTARAGAGGLVVSLVGHGDTRTVSRMQRDLEIPAPMTPPDIEALMEGREKPLVRVAPNKTLAVVAGDDAGRRSPRPQRPRRHNADRNNGDRQNGDRAPAQARDGRAGRDRPQRRRAS
jgi:superfamily II DNA/RNA helicase